MSIRDLLEHLVVASKHGSGAGDADSDTDGVCGDDDDDVNGTRSVRDAEDLEAFESQFNRKGRRACRREEMKRGLEK
jgi:hypothetical protein